MANLMPEREIIKIHSFAIAIIYEMLVILFATPK
jgi:hypothetical protein